MLTINENLSIPLREFEFSFSRSPGPGGQNVNKLNTKVTLRWNIGDSPSIPEAVKQRFKRTHSRRINKQGELFVSSHRFRDQGRNVADTLNKVRELILSVATPPRVRKKTKPSKSSKKRRLENKRHQSATKRLRRNPADE